MADYYLYLLDKNGSIRHRLDLALCRDDDHARDVAAAYPHDHGMELWREGRLVETYDHPGRR